MGDNKIVKKEEKIISVKEARKKYFGAKYKDISDEVLEIIIKELEQLAEITLGFP